LAMRRNADVTIHDDDLPENNTSLDVVSPSRETNSRGSLTMTLEPPEASGKWGFAWEKTWSESGNTASHLATGDYLIRYSARDGYMPLPDTTYRVTNGTAAFYTSRFTLLRTARQGALSVKILPSIAANGANGTLKGQWRLQNEVSGTWHDSEEVISNLPSALHGVELKPLAGIGYGTPAPFFAQVAPDETVIYEVTYQPLSGQFPMILSNFFQLHSIDYPFMGQIVSDSGYGSGFVAN